MSAQPQAPRPWEQQRVPWGPPDGAAPAQGPLEGGAETEQKLKDPMDTQRRRLPGLWRLPAASQPLPPGAELHKHTDLGCVHVPPPTRHLRRGREHLPPEDAQPDAQRGDLRADAQCEVRPAPVPAVEAGGRIVAASTPAIPAPTGRRLPHPPAGALTGGGPHCVDQSDQGRAGASVASGGCRHVIAIVIISPGNTHQESP